MNNEKRFDELDRVKNKLSTILDGEMNADHDAILMAIGEVQRAIFEDMNGRCNCECHKQNEPHSVLYDARWCKCGSDGG